MMKVNVQLYKVQFLNMIKHTQPQTCCLYVLRCLVPEVLSTMDLFTSGKEKVKLGELQALNFLMLSGLSDPGGQDDTGGLTLRGWLNYRVNHPKRDIFLPSQPYACPPSLRGMRCFTLIDQSRKLPCAALTKENYPWQASKLTYI